MAKHNAGGKKSGPRGKKTESHAAGKPSVKSGAKPGAKPAHKSGLKPGPKSEIKASGKAVTRPQPQQVGKPAGSKQASASRKPEPSGTSEASGITGTLIIGTRGSTLALTQSNMMADALRQAHKGLDVKLVVIKTVGDTDQKTKLNAFTGMGVFVKELQAALLDGSIDCAVHSLKDVPEDEPDGLMLAAFPEREDPRDVMVSDGRNFRALPAGSKVGTGSPRRVLQLKALRPDLEYIPVRGNVDTRISKVRNGELQGVILAAAGMRRLGRAEEITHPFSFQDLIPAIGQASLGIECRAGDARVRKILAAVDDDITHDAVTLERMFMKRIGGGCKVPMAAHVYPYGEGMRMLAVLGNPENGTMARVEQTLEEGEEEEMVEELAMRMEELCREKGIPLPHELPEHHLLTTNPEANSES